MDQTLLQSVPPRRHCKHSRQLCMSPFWYPSNRSCSSPSTQTDQTNSSSPRTNRHGNCRIHRHQNRNLTPLPHTNTLRACIVLWSCSDTLHDTPSPIFALITGDSTLIGGSYNDAMATVDIVFNSAVAILNFLGLGFLVWGWPELIERQVGSAKVVDKPMAAVIPQG